ncbi:phosphoglycerate mutase-like protein [Rickenella mellea]|uniref:Phosphoglycerate mutase-like protein n=1 Tax=Rickenella mellea TaxID=50990 RepID=A0A4Y7PVN7_9AGAM|nr:phosphoglycerate mutase-like protein [Rickenella mellea]
MEEVLETRHLDVLDAADIASTVKAAKRTEPNRAAARSYHILPGFFIQDRPLATPLPPDEPILPRFGLLDASDERWETFKDKLEDMNAAAPSGTSFRLIFLGRHGQGYHNVAEAKYGTEQWDAHWAKLDTDGELVWGPDPDLTPAGEDQARAAHDIWEEELAYNIQIPQKFYSSPLTRAIRTCQLSFDGLVNDPHCRPEILENCREEYGVHTCDRRRTLTYLRETFPHFTIERGFTEDDELWKPDKREKRDHLATRARMVLDRIFNSDSEYFVSISAHSGIIRGFIDVTGHVPFDIPVGGVLPMVVRGTVKT